MADDTDAATNGSSATSSGVVSRRVAPFVPVAIALLAQTALLPGSTTTQGPDTAAICSEEIPSYQECHSEYPTGCSKAGGYDPYLNLLKNQLVPPAKAPFQFLDRESYAKLEMSLPPDLSKDNHEDFKDQLAALGEGQVAGLIGYLYYAKKGGKESSNCQLTEPTDIDFHIGIGFDAGLAGKLAGKGSLTTEEKSALKKQSVIVEMTPHWRAQFQPNWELAALTPAIGHKVRVTGQLLVDNEHFESKDDCSFSGASSACWRAGVWELHPVTGFQVCGTGEDCDANSTGWIDLLDFDAAPTPAPKSAPAPATPPAPAPT